MNINGSAKQLHSLPVSPQASGPPNRHDPRPHHSRSSTSQSGPVMLCLNWFSMASCVS